MMNERQLPVLPFTQPNSSGTTGYAVRRIICIGRNYAEHAKEMGHAPNEAPPFFFYKPITALSYAGLGLSLPLPAYSHNVHHELELLIAIGEPPNKEAPETAISAYGLALDMTCRDTQTDAKTAGRPWDTAKGFDQSAPCSALVFAGWDDVQKLDVFNLQKNGETVQTGHIKEMIWPIPELLKQVMQYTQLDYGDIILTGTPAGVGAVVPGDTLRASISNNSEVELNVAITATNEAVS